MDLNLDGDDLNTCVQCGLCLPHCPTFRVTGEESMSPRGRIQLMREVQLEDAPVTREVLDSFETCVQCRGCEPACPSSVPYGHLMEQSSGNARREREDDATVAAVGAQAVGQARAAARWHRGALGSHEAQVGAAAARDSRRVGSPGEPLEATGEDVYLFTGCVMDVWQRDVHRASQRVIEAAGFGATPTNELAPCCGALHAHAGLAGETRTLAEHMMRNLSSDDRPILVDSAGCGAAMKDYGHLLDTDEARAFSERVFDIQEWLADHVAEFPSVAPLELRVAVQDPCHLRHVQRVHEATRVVLKPFVRELRELDDDGLCCGAGGAYSVLQPELAGEIRQRKVDAVARARPDAVASANPGCSMHLAAVGVPTIHPMELVDAALRGLDVDL